VFNASTGINPQSGQLANMAATNTTNNGLPRGSYSETGDGAARREDRCAGTAGADVHVRRDRSGVVLAWRVSP